MTSYFYANTKKLLVCITIVHTWEEIAKLMISSRAFGLFLNSIHMTHKQLDIDLVVESLLVDKCGDVDNELKSVFI